MRCFVALSILCCNAWPAAAIVGPAAPAGDCEVLAMTSAMPARSARFGRTLDLHEDRAIVTEQTSTFGRVYLFERSPIGVWSLEGQFGFPVQPSAPAVAIDQDWAALAVNNQVRLYRKKPTGWVLHATVQGADTVIGDEFGSDVALSGEYMLVGAYRDDNAGGADAGAAYVFRYLAGPDDWFQIAKLSAPDATGFEWFGRSVDLDGNVAVVGAPQDDDQGALSGSAYVFDPETGSWQLVTKLLASDGGADRRFGSDVAVSGRTAVVAGSGIEAAYIYEDDDTAWVETRLAEPAAMDYGRSVSISGDRVLVGAPDTVDAFGTASGAVFVHTRTADDWVRSFVFTSGCGGDSFGEAVAVHADDALAGAPGGFVDVYDRAGRAHVYLLGPDCLPPPPDCDGNDIADLDELGWSMQLIQDFEGQPLPPGVSESFSGEWHATSGCNLPPSGNCAQAGAFAYAGKEGQTNCGGNTPCNYTVFDITGDYCLSGIQLPPDPAGARLEFCMAREAEGCDHDRTLIEVNGCVVDECVLGSNFQWASFELDLAHFAGQEVTICWRFSSDDGLFDCSWGWGIDNITVGQNVATPADEDANGVLDACDCGATPYCLTNPNSTGAHARIFHAGSLSLSANDLVLRANGLPRAQFGVFFFGPEQVQVPFGDGFRCVGGAIRRIDPPVPSVNGQATLPLDLTAPPLDVLEPGDTTNFQFWFRDPAAGGAGFNLTNAIAVQFCS